MDASEDASSHAADGKAGVEHRRSITAENLKTFKYIFFHYTSWLHRAPDAGEPLTTVGKSQISVLKKGKQHKKGIKKLYIISQHSEYSRSPHAPGQKQTIHAHTHTNTKPLNLFHETNRTNNSSTRRRVNPEACKNQYDLARVRLAST